MTAKYLVCITTDNHNKYYHMIPNGDNFIVKYGRIGANPQQRTYPMSQWDKKYSEKINKGYIDQSDLALEMVEEVKTKPAYKEIENRNIAKIVERLQTMANQSVKSNYRLSANKITQAMVDKAQSQIDYMARAFDENSSMYSFNEALLTLFGIIPRKMSDVADFLANSRDDYAKILKREQDLLDVMRQQVQQAKQQAEANKPTPDDSKPEHDETILEKAGLIFEEVSDEDIEHIKKLLGRSSYKFKQAWKITNLKTQAKFDKFVKDEHIHKIKQLWHGSRNENWWSIINTGLVLRPANAKITGKLYGYGTYFAPKAQKSIGYTSLAGSYWAGGNSSSGFMAIMDVAYGKPYDVYDFDSKYYNLNYKRLQQFCPGANSLHAHAGANIGASTLRNDEIVVYREDQCTIKYLVEIQ